ncbi:hypothetical protein GLOIN_2v1709643 [Rhizophagus irregularis DAOM 181602=DAOM 197198]|nr:hypothetical protein RhiirB3_453341 [Rhizophagus irregularis]GET57009.1 hypothetical protein GLOIN_2v1709643 [Rhizophagus irregularis DAOM 181602=DAOM 197198]
MYTWTYFTEDDNPLLKILKNYHNNYEFLISQLDIKINIKLSTTRKFIINDKPFYNINLKNYFEKQLLK